MILGLSEGLQLRKAEILDHKIHYAVLCPDQTYEYETSSEISGLALGSGYLLRFGWFSVTDIIRFIAFVWC